MEEFARRGEAIFEHDIRPKVQNEDENAFVLIDIETGDFKVDKEEMAASDRLLTRLPRAQVWTRKVGSLIARPFGGRSDSKKS